ncbi:histone H1.2-like [Heptranchias perlo]|uniref:histone H1.2-like n=1 Tax=Heptranchias perlo TaxID=212740 RepID=UPI0035593CC8
MRLRLSHHVIISHQPKTMPKVRRAAPGVSHAPPKKTRQHRPYRRQRKKELRISQLILQALSARKQRGGLSLASLRKALLANGYDAEKNKARVQLAVKSLVSNGSLVQTKGKGATDSFMLSKRQEQQSKESGAGVKAKKETTASNDEAKNAVKNPKKRRAEKKATPSKAKARRPRK